MAERCCARCSGSGTGPGRWWAHARPAGGAAGSRAGAGSTPAGRDRPTTSQWSPERRRCRPPRPRGRCARGGPPGAPRAARRTPRRATGRDHIATAKRGGLCSQRGLTSQRTGVHAPSRERTRSPVATPRRSTLLRPSASSSSGASSGCTPTAGGSLDVIGLPCPTGSPGEAARCSVCETHHCLHLFCIDRSTISYRIVQKACGGTTRSEPMLDRSLQILPR